MKRPAIFFDRDNTLIANDGYLGDPAQVHLIAGAADAIARCRALGYAIVVVSNQSGVARGLFDEEAVHAVNDRMDQLLRSANPNAQIDRHEFCPFHPEAKVERYRQDSPLRKPKPGMILGAAEILGLDLSRSWLVGDAPRDIAAGKAAGCGTILFCGVGLSPSPSSEENGLSPDQTVATLIEAVDFIEKHKSTSPAPALPSEPKPIAAPKPPTIKAAIAPVAAKTVGGTPMIPGIKPLALLAQAAKPILKPLPSAVKPVIPSNAKLESLAEQILVELKRRNDIHPDDFSVSKLLAGIVQVLALASLFLAYVQARGSMAGLQVYLLVALTLQTMTIALLIMSRQK